MAARSPDAQRQQSLVFTMEGMRLVCQIISIAGCGLNKDFLLSRCDGFNMFTDNVGRTQSEKDSCAQEDHREVVELTGT